MRIMTDVECYTDYFMVGFLNPETGKIVQFEKFEGHEFDAKSVMAIMRKRQTVGFNSNGYDCPMIFLACAGLTNEQLKQASDMIIVGKRKPWHLEEHFGVQFPKVDHIDLFEIPAGDASLKIYGGRVHSQRLQDLPIKPDQLIDPVRKPKLRQGMLKYNGNDLWLTYDLLKAVIPRLELREKLGEEYGMDLRSKSDAQIAEAVMKSELQKITGRKYKNPEIGASGWEFAYKAPDFLKFQTPELRKLFNEVKRAKFTLTPAGKVEAPPELEGRIVRIGSCAFRMGIGGLHSCEKSRAHYADDDHILIDRDVRSFYPITILNNGWFPKHLGPSFLKVLANIVRRRLAAKAAGDDVIAEVLKIVVNGVYGKLGSIWSALYSPDLMIQVTVTGQLSLLMFIERLHLAGIRVISANTDGLMIKVRRDMEDELSEVVTGWENDTNYETEETRYSAVFSRDVSNYVAIYEKPVVKKGKTIYAKLKGAYADPGLAKNPTNQICVEAVIDHLIHGHDIADTIHQCDDVRRFVSIRKVDGGAEKDAEEIGKAIRWYYSTSTDTAIHYVRTGNLVPRTEGAMPLMDLPDDFPDDVDYDWYVREAKSILGDIGATRRIPVLGPRITKQIEALV